MLDRTHFFMIWDTASGFPCTYRFFPGSRQDNPLPEEESSESIGQNSSWNIWVPFKAFTIESSFFEETEATDKRESQQTDCPPELNGEKRVRRNKTRECRTGNRSEQKRHVQRSKSAATLMQEKHIGYDARAKHRRHGTEEASKEPGDHIWNIVTRVGHDGTPDLAY